MKNFVLKITGQLLSVAVFLTASNAFGMACSTALGSKSVLHKTSHQKIKELSPQVNEVNKAMAHYSKTQDEAIELLPVLSSTFYEYYRGLQAQSDQLILANAKNDVKEISAIESDINSLLSTFAMSIETKDVKNDSGKSLALYAELKASLKKKGSINKSDILKAFITLEYLESDVAAIVWNKALKFSEVFDAIEFHSRRIVNLSKKINQHEEKLKTTTVLERQESTKRQMKLAIDEVVIHMEAITSHYYGVVARDFQNLNPEFRP